MAKVPVSRRYYEPIPGETHKAWMAFCVYRDMGNGRSLDKAWQKGTGKDGRHARHWATWSVKNHWVSRCCAYDNALIRKARQQIEKERVSEYAEKYGRFW